MIGNFAPFLLYHILSEAVEYRQVNNGNALKIWLNMYIFLQMLQKYVLSE